MLEQSYKISVNNQVEFDEVLALAGQLGYISILEWRNIKTVKTLFLNGQDKDIQWSHHPVAEYLNKKGYKEITLSDLRSLANQDAL